MAEFLHMGGHGFYIWTSYFIVLAVLLYTWLSPRYRRKRQLQSLFRQIRRR